MENAKMIISRILEDEELFKGGTPEAEKELQELGFTEKQAGDICRKLRGIAEQIEKKV